MTTAEIMCIYWLAENVLGHIPTVKELIADARCVVSQEGINKGEDEE